MFEATINGKGQVTIPADVCRAMGLEAGDRVIFIQLEDGTTVLRVKRHSIRELKGLLKPARPRRRPISVKDMNIGRR